MRGFVSKTCLAIEKMVRQNPIIGKYINSRVFYIKPNELSKGLLASFYVQDTEVFICDHLLYFGESDGDITGSIVMKNSQTTEEVPFSLHISKSADGKMGVPLPLSFVVNSNDVVSIQFQNFKQGPRVVPFEIAFSGLIYQERKAQGFT